MAGAESLMGFCYFLWSFGAAAQMRTDRGEPRRRTALIRYRAAPRDAEMPRESPSLRTVVRVVAMRWELRLHPHRQLPGPRFRRVRRQFRR